MLELQIQILSMWWSAGDRLRQRLSDARSDDRGEITSTTAVIVILVAAAIAAGAVIAAKIKANADNVPSP